MRCLQLFVFASFFGILGSFSQAGAAPAAGRVRIHTAGFEDAAARASINIALPTMGRSQFTLAKRAAWLPDSIHLYQGVATNKRNANLGLSADRSGQALRLRFFGRRKIGVRRRLYTLFLQQTSNQAWKLRRVSSYPLAVPALLPPGAPLYNPERYIEISTQADFEYYKVYKSETNAQIQALLNAAEALYREQVGLRFDLVAQHVFREAGPLKSGFAANLLLQFQDYTNRRRHLGQPDMFHLFTGKHIFGGIIGLSFVGQACSPSNSFSLTSKINENIRFLVTAHEIGHNLGASHPEDTQAGAAPSLMTGVVRPANNAFSEFSLGELSSFIDQSGACLTGSRGAALQLQVQQLTGELRIAALIEGGEQCNLEVYAAARRKALRPPGLSTSSGARLLFQQAITGAMTERQEALIEKENGVNRRVYVRGEIVCPDGEIRQSGVSELTLRMKRGASRRAALRLVLQSFFASTPA